MNKAPIEDEQHSNDMSLTELKTRLDKWLNSQYKSILAINTNDEVVAYTLYRDDPEYYCLRHLFINRLHRHKGIASRLLEHLESNTINDKSIRIEVLNHNTEAMHFYRTCGYLPYSTTLQMPADKISQQH